MKVKNDQLDFNFSRPIDFQKNLNIPLLTERFEDFFPDKKSNEFKLKNLSYFGDVLQTEYYLSQLPNMKND